MALGARTHLMTPIDLKSFHSKSSRSSRLPAGISVNRTNKINAVHLLAVENPFGTDISGINEMMMREEILGGQIGLNELKRMMILLNRRYCLST
jgi:hypothetical protein